MANLQIKNLPESLHEWLREQAQRQHRTISDLALLALERERARQDWHSRLAQRPTAELGVSAASLLEEERHQREHEIA